MVVRGADYPRKANEDYRTPAEPVLALRAGAEAIARSPLQWPLSA